MRQLDDLLRRLADAFRMEGTAVVVTQFPPWNEGVFAELSRDLPPQVTQAARHIILGHLDGQSKGGKYAWMGSTALPARAQWNESHLVTAYYLRCQPGAA